MVKIPLQLNRVLFILAFVGSLGACSAVPPQQSPGQFDFAVKNARKTSTDPEIERSSEALHEYLKGKLQLGKESYDDAFKSFSRAAELLPSPEPAVSSTLAELYVRDGDLEKALEQTKKVLEKKPGDVPTLVLYGGILDSLKRSDESIPVYKEILAKDPRNFETYILLSSLYLRRGDKNAAFDILKSLEKQFPKDSLALAVVAQGYELAGDLKTAEKYLWRVYETDEGKNAHSLDLVRVLIKRREIARAKHVCNEILARDPGNVVVRKLMGALFLGENNYDEALKHLSILEQSESDNTDTRLKIGLIQMGKQNFPEAIREFSLVLAQRPDNEEARYYLATVYSGMGRRDDAITELEKIKPDGKMFVKSRMLGAFILKQDGNLGRAEELVREGLTVEPANRQLFDYLISLLREDGKLSEASTIVENALQSKPDDAKLNFSYAVILSDLQKSEKSEQVLESIISKDPKNAEALNFVAYSYSDRGVMLDRSLSYVQRALEIDPANAYYVDTLGWVYFKMGDLEKAVATLAKAVSIVGDDIVLLEHYGDALSKKGSLTEALAVYKRALRLESSSKEREQIESRARVQAKVDAMLKYHPDLSGAELELRP